MTTKTIENKAYWIKQIEAYRLGKYPSKNTFCLQKDVSYHRFLYWFSKLAEQLAVKDKLPAKSPLIPIQVVNKSEAPLCILEFKQGHKLKIYNESILRKLIELLSE